VPFARCQHAGRIHYAERGEPRPGRLPVLLIHGAGASAAIWMMTLARLGRVTRTVAIDLPGHGPSPEGPGASLDAYRDAVGALAAAVCLGRAVLVGHSMGALIAVQAALAWPDKVAGLVLCAAAARLPVSAQVLDVIRGDYGRFPAWLAERAFSPAAKPGLRRAFVAAGVAAPQAVTLADFQLVTTADVGPSLPRLACPVVWLDGADDGIVGRDARADRPGEARVVADAGHLIPVESPQAVAAAAAALADAAAPAGGPA
jgi:pimeloyl-ACP methyl ester carboxylesterase